jgi:hypothetical protein
MNDEKVYAHDSLFNGDGGGQDRARASFRSSIRNMLAFSADIATTEFVSNEQMS